MSPMFSIVVACHNERPEDVEALVQSIGKSPWVQIIIVDDHSQVAPLKHVPPGVMVIETGARLGVGKARHLGVEMASAPLCIITDGHCLFEKGWLHDLWPVMRDGGEKLLVCGSMVALQEGARDMSNPISRYYGARMVIHDPAEPLRWRVLSEKWAKEKPGDYYELSAVSGACYCFHKSTFLALRGSKYLKNWGGDEANLSIKFMRYGGRIMLLKSWTVGHKFRSGPPPYKLVLEDCIENTMAIAKACCPPDVAKDLIAKISPGVEALRAREAIGWRKAELEAERLELDKLFTVPWDSYVKKIAEIDSE